MRIRAVKIIPLEVVARNIVAGSLSRRTGLDEGVRLKTPIVEFYYKDDDLGDPLLTSDHIRILDLATEEEQATLRRMALEINEHLISLWKKCGLDLVDFKLEFGRVDGRILLADEISPDTQRLWDADGNRMDKDVFRARPRGPRGDIRQRTRAAHRRIPGVRLRRAAGGARGTLTPATSRSGTGR